ncbi:MAG: transcriptional repressor LexA [Leptospirillia bacterium]
MDTLTPKARLVLGYIEDFSAAHGHPPSMREIGEGCGIRSTRSVSDYLKKLEGAGRIRRREGKSRGIEVVHGAAQKGANAASVPMLGRIAAGGPLAAYADAVEHLPVDAHALFGERDCFALEVTGDSMEGMHIVEGDTVLIRPQATAHPGEVVAAEVDGEVTLKVYREDGEKILLVPANPAYTPIVLDGSQPVRILGIMVGLMRGTPRNG